MFLREVTDIPVAMWWQYAPRRWLEHRKMRQLREMVRVCRDRVPYYRDDDRYRGPEPVELADLAALPLLDKHALRSRPVEDFLAEGVDLAGCRQFRTSGSTGQRVTVWHDQRAHDYHMAACVRRFAATRRYLPTDRLVHIRPYESPRRRFESLNLFRRYQVMSHLPMAELKREVLGQRPRVLIGQPLHVRELLRALTPAELVELRRRLRLIFTESELLTPQLRQALREGYGVPIFDEYSAFEVLNIYFECHLGGRHLAEDRVHLEVLDPAGRPLPAGEEGRLVVTHYLERAMPLLRYAIGDIGRLLPEPCGCGRTFQVMELTRGRADDFVLLPSGRRLFPDTFIHIAATHDGVDECFVEQDAAGRVRIGVVPSREVTELSRVLDSVRQEVQRLAGEPFPLAVTAADRLPLTVGGKGRFVSSEYAGGA